MTLVDFTDGPAEDVDLAGTTGRYVVGIETTDDEWSYRGYVDPDVAAQAAMVAADFHLSVCTGIAIEVPAAPPEWARTEGK